MQQEVFAGVPDDLRHSIISGMRWTVWLSALALPFSYGTTILLARVGPEVVGTFGLLSLYVVFATTLVYLGGDAVVIKFLPGLEKHRQLSFLVTYMMVVFAASLPWILVAVAWPASLRVVFGHEVSSRLEVAILALTPVCLLYSMVAAALKGFMEMRWAQMLLRLLTVGTFCCYALLFLFRRRWLVYHYTELIWGIYFALVLAAIAVGLRQLSKMGVFTQEQRPVRWFLPNGFWRYTLALEGGSALNFGNRLDYILILDVGGLSLLGKYVALMTFANLERSVGKYIVEALLPSLTNLLARGQVDATSTTLNVFIRVLDLAIFGMASVFICFSQELLRIFGKSYTDLGPALLLMVLFGAIRAATGIMGVVLTSFSEQHHVIWIQTVQIATFVSLFYPFWHRWQLIGAVMVFGLSQAAAAVLMLFVVLWKTPTQASVFYPYLPFTGLLVLLILIGTLAPPLNIVLRTGEFLASCGTFLLLAGYNWTECKRMFYFFSPAILLRQGTSSLGQ